MRILYVSAHYPPDISALANRVRELTSRWAGEGHEVHVLCGRPAHPTGRVPPQYRRRAYVKEVVEGVTIHRTWLYATPNAGRVRRAASFVSAAGSGLAVGMTRLPVPDVVIGSSPQILFAVVAALLARRFGRPWVLEVRDLWPRAVWEVGAVARESLLVRVLEGVERALYRDARKVVVLSPAFQDDIASRTRLPIEDLPLIPNGVDLDRFDVDLDGSALRRELGLPLDVPVALYGGTHGMAHGLEVIVEAARRTPEAQFVMVGEGARKEALVELGRDVPNLRFLPGQPRDRMPEVLAMSDIALVPMRDIPLNRTIIPAKIFEIWAMARPAVVGGLEGVAPELVRGSGSGLTIPPEDPDALSAAVRRLAANAEERRRMGLAGRRLVEERYTWDRLAEDWLEVMRELAPAGSAERRVPFRPAVVA